MSYVENTGNVHGSESAHYLPELTDDFQQFEQEANEHVTLEPDAIRSSPVPVIVDDSQSLTDREQYLVTDSVAVTDSVVIDRYFTLKIWRRSLSVCYCKFSD